MTRLGATALVAILTVIPAVALAPAASAATSAPTPKSAPAATSVATSLRGEKAQLHGMLSGLPVVGGLLGGGNPPAVPSPSAVDPLLNALGSTVGLAANLLDELDCGSAATIAGLAEAELVDPAVAGKS